MHFKNYRNAVLQLMFATYPLSHYFLNDHYKSDLNEDNSRYKGRMIVPYVKLLVISKNSKQLVTPFDLLAAICNIWLIYIFI